MEYTNSTATITTTEARPHNKLQCADFALTIRDTLDVISGKWKPYIIGSLRQGKKRFSELEREIPKITARMLSKELREMEVNQLVIRHVDVDNVQLVEYELTPYAYTLDRVFLELRTWGLQHRQRMMQ